MGTRNDQNDCIALKCISCQIDIPIDSELSQQDVTLKECQNLLKTNFDVKAIIFVPPYNGNSEMSTCDVLTFAMHGYDHEVEYSSSVHGEIWENICKPLVDYTAVDGYHCGGTNLRNWSNGDSSNYGSVTILSECQKECALRGECKGFLFRKSDGVCGMWKTGVLDLTASAQSTCYLKNSNNNFVS